MVLALPMGNEIMLAFKPLGAFDTVMLTKTWQVFGVFRSFVLREMFVRSEICSDLIVIPVYVAAIRFNPDSFREALSGRFLNVSPVHT